MKKTVVFGSDHAGLWLKKVLMERMGEDWQIMDVGTREASSCDYPVYAGRVCEKVLELHCMGVLICGSGLGMSMTANRFRGIRAALCCNEYMARMSRKHNNANVLCMGERVIGVDLAGSIQDVFLETGFEGGRHAKRLDIIEEIAENPDPGSFLSAGGA